MSIYEELHGYYFEDLKVGMTACYSKTITDAAIETFAGLSGDTNPLHISNEYAAESRFKERIAHGMLTMTNITGVLGTKLPGPGCLYMSQTVKFVSPVKIGDTVTTRVTVKELNPEKNRVTFKTDCFVGDKQCIDGEALIWVPSRNK
jgi:3-hydroxybutyryl-CoA dehydratase